jgi:uncharacterized protein (TIGR02246 family)
VLLSVGDRLDILELLARADDAASRRDVASYLDLFTDDAVLAGDKGEHRGKAALELTVGPVWISEGPNTRHLTLNAVIEAENQSPSTAVATSTLVIVVPGSPIQMQSVSAITQQVVKVNGRWLIRRRAVSVLR